eukprot:scaffold6276_cov138-Cylindrotheca_fusiformis.AAC.19
MHDHPVTILVEGIIALLESSETVVMPQPEPLLTSPPRISNSKSRRKPTSIDRSKVAMTFQIVDVSSKATASY